MEIRKFALVVIDDFDNEIERFMLDYVESPKNLGFEMEFTTIETQLTTYFTRAIEKKLSTELTLNFIRPNAYEKANAFRYFVQKNMNNRVVLEYDDTTGQVKNWEGKVQKFTVTEKDRFGGLSGTMQFLPATPKYQKINNTVVIKYSSIGKKYPVQYPYAYGRTIVENSAIPNTYFAEIPLRVYIYGSCANLYLALSDENGDVYSKFEMQDLTIAENEHVVVDAISNKVKLWRDGKYIDAYDYVNKASDFDSFLFAKQNTISKLNTGLTALDSGEVRATYRQYVL